MKNVLFVLALAAPFVAQALRPTLVAQTPRATPPALPSFAEPCISPDGSTIAFVSGGDIWEVPARGGDVRLLVSHPATESRPLFSPDGTRLAFTSTRTGNGDVYLLTLATGDLTRLTFDDANELVSFFSADAVWNDGPRGTYHGVDAIRAEIEAQAQVVPSITVEVKNLVANGGTVMVERADIFEVQGKSFDLEVVGVFELNGHGRITRFRDYYDLTSLMDRVGAAFTSGA